MSKIYDNAFKVGVGINLLLFLFLNFVSYIIAYSELYERQNSKGLRLSGGGYKWGFPFEMYHNFYGYPNDIGFDRLGVAANAVVIIICSFIAGFIAQFVWSDIISHRIKRSQNN